MIVGIDPASAYVVVVRRSSVIGRACGGIDQGIVVTHYPAPLLGDPVQGGPIAVRSEGVRVVIPAGAARTDRHAQSHQLIALKRLLNVSNMDQPCGRYQELLVSG